MSDILRLKTVTFVPICSTSVLDSLGPAAATLDDYRGVDWSDGAKPSWFGFELLRGGLGLLPLALSGNGRCSHGPHLSTNSYAEAIMEVPVTEDQIRTLAFYLWQQDGGPGGRSDEYWEKARQQLGAGTEVTAAEEATSSGSRQEAEGRPLAE
jgi:Protein of unknown function (DUF2934)